MTISSWVEEREKHMTILRTFAAFAIFALTITAIPASASGFPSVTVRVDHSTVDAELGACAEGRRIVVVTAGRTHWSGYGASDLTVDPIRPDMAMSINLACDGELERIPSHGVSIEMH